ncbi:MAG TPA: hypothetical protein VMF13_01775 [Luteitalea sp.]|nr:hypothetical protein [Luteitalea sp.]
MRALMPLFTAAALAVGGWLAWGIVTVRSLDDPSRIGLLPPLPLLPALFVALAAIGVLASRLTAPPRRQPVAPALALMAPVVLPWLPLPVPQVWLVWTGPLAVGLWIGAIACVHADAFARAASRVQRWGDLLTQPRTAPWMAAVVTGAALLATALHTAPQHPKGDEPDYLIVAQSLWLDGDLRIENNHARADYAAYHRDPLPPSYLQRGVDGQIYSVHAPGLPAVLVPAFALAGYPGAVAFLILVAMAGAALAWRAAYDVTGSAAASWFGAVATVGSAPFFLHGAAIFPDAPASVLALVATRAVILDAQGRATRWWVAGAALAALPWLHTRYAIIAAVIGLVIVVRVAGIRAWRDLAAFAVIPVVVALGWLAFFQIVYGTPNPSVPYGAYTQMALAHLAPGLPGLLFDQQFGLFTAAPVLALALVAARPSIRRAQPAIWRVVVVVLLLAVAYACTVGAYRMWWGGLSAPARFLVPLVLPMAPAVALAWQSQRRRASRHAACAALIVSLALTAALATVDHGALAYNTRDGAARVALWAGPLVDLVTALPAAHRDAPPVVVRDVAIWLGVIALTWAALRWLEATGRLRPWSTCLAVAALVPTAAAITLRAHGAPSLQPIGSQVTYLERRASSASTLWTITPPPTGRTRTWFEIELDTRRGRGAGDFTLLRIPRLPAGRYALQTTAIAAGARLGVTLGETRATRFLAEVEASTAPVAPASFTLVMPVDNLLVKGSREAAAAGGRTWLTAIDVAVEPSAHQAARVHPLGTDAWLLPDEGVYPEPEGIWLAGDTSVMVGTPQVTAVPLVVRAGPAPVVVEWTGTASGVIQLAAGEAREVVVAPRNGRLALRTVGGFRPSAVTEGSTDQRWLGAWLAPR